MITVIPEANYVTSERNRVRVYSPHNFVACIDTSWNGCIPSVRNKPYADLVPSETASEYYLAYGFTSDLYTSMKVYRLPLRGVEETAQLLIGIYTDPDGKQHLVYKIGAPVDIPAIEKVWYVDIMGRIYYLEAGYSEPKYIGTVEDTFFTISTEGFPPIIIKPKVPWALVILVLASIGATVWWAVETHKANVSAEVQKHAIDKYYEYLDNLQTTVKENPEIAHAFLSMLEGLHASMRMTWEMPAGLTTYRKEEGPSSMFDKFIGWLKNNWFTAVGLVGGIIALMLMVMKINVIRSVFEAIIDTLRGRRRR